MSNNRLDALLDDEGLQLWHTLSSAEAIRYLKELLRDAQQTLPLVRQHKGPPTWDSLIRPFDEVHDRLERFWVRVEHFQSVMDDPRWRYIDKIGTPLVTRYYTQFKQNSDFFRQLETLRRSKTYRNLSPSRRRVIELMRRDFILAGAQLDRKKQRQLQGMIQQISRLSTEFSNRLLDATKAGNVWVVDRADLEGIPKPIVAAARSRARKRGRKGWAFSIQAPESLIVLQTAKSRTLRSRLFTLSIARASELGPRSTDNTIILARILKVRQTIAKQVGFSTFAELSLSKKMAKTPSRAVRFVKQISHLATPSAKKEFQGHQRFARQKLHLPALLPSDLDFVAEQVRQSQFGFTKQNLRPYFPSRAVLAVLQETIKRVFGVRLRPKRLPRPYLSEVLAYDAVAANGRVLGRVLLDLYARPNKRSGAWARNLTSRRIVKSRERTPVAICACNFPKPDAHGGSNLSHEEVLTLFHEFGHILNQLLSTITEPRVGGTNGVEWDAVELPSQFFERFVWQPFFFSALVRHGARPMPTSLQSKVANSKTFMGARRVVRQAQLALFDLELYRMTHPRQTTALALWQKIQKKYSVTPYSTASRLPHSFQHIFHGAYAAGYYSYLWAEVMAADAFELFRNKPRQWRKMGQKFRQEILAVGGSRPAAESFKNFRGRLPRSQYLLKDYGLRRS